MNHAVIALVAGLIAASAAYLLALPLQLGAHPFWADQVLLYGAAIGALLALLSLRLPYALRVIGFVVLTGAAFAVAHIGKTRFAASFAEDALAGQMWFFGWHAVCASAVAATISAAYQTR